MDNLCWFILNHIFLSKCHNLWIYVRSDTTGESTSSLFPFHPAGIYLLKVNSRNTRIRCEICSKLTIKTPERLWTFFAPCSSVSINKFEQVNAGWTLFVITLLKNSSRQSWKHIRLHKDWLIEESSLC